MELVNSQTFHDTAENVIRIFALDLGKLVTAASDTDSTVHLASMPILGSVPDFEVEGYSDSELRSLLPVAISFAHEVDSIHVIWMGDSTPCLWLHMGTNVWTSIREDRLTQSLCPPRLMPTDNLAM